MRAQEATAEVEEGEELIEPTLVLLFPPQAVAECGTADTTEARLQTITASAHAAVPQAQPVDADRPHSADVSASRQDAAAGATAPLDVGKDALHLPACVSPTGANPPLNPPAAYTASSGLQGATYSGSKQHQQEAAPSAQAVAMPDALANEAPDCEQTKDAVSGPQPTTEDVMLIDNAVSAALSHPGASAVGNDSWQLVMQLGEPATTCSSSGALHVQSVVRCQLGSACMPEGQGTHAKGQAALPEGYEGNTERQAGDQDRQKTRPSGQTALQEGQVAVTDGQRAKAEGQATMSDRQANTTDGQDTISDACCVCCSAEDGEVMLLCDKCDKPAHLGCVGVAAVPEGDWFCPACIASKVLTLPRMHCPP